MKKQLRTDVLMGKNAEEFARENTNFYLTEGIYDETGFKFLKSSNSDEYYIAKISKKEKLLSTGSRLVLDMINTTPLNPVLINGEFHITNPNLSFGCNVAVEDDEKIKTLYFGDTLYLYKNEEDRNNFELFRLECCNSNDSDKFNSLDKLSEYFSDENFVLMAKDEAFFLAFKLSDNPTPVRSSLFEHKIKKEIDKRVKKYAGQSAEGGQMGEE